MPSIPCHPPCRAVPSPVGSPHGPLSRASTFPREVTGRSHVGLAPPRAFVGRLPCTPLHWEPVARAGPMSPAPYRGHCSTAGAMLEAGRGRGTASPLGCGIRGTPTPGQAGGGGMAGLAMGWGPGCSLTSGTPTFGGSHPQHRGCHHRSPPASPCCDVRRRETEARPGCAGWGHAAPRSPWFRGSPTRGQRGPAGAPPPFALGLLGGPAQPRPPLPSASSLPGSGGDGHGTRAGWGGEGKGKRWDYGGGTQ